MYPAKIFSVEDNLDLRGEALQELDHERVNKSSNSGFRTNNMYSTGQHH